MDESPHSDPYSRQVLFPPIGAAGQQLLASRTVVLVGCGALGATLAELLVRAGVGRLRLIDRDVVERSNLGRQALYDRHDADEGLPKAVALARHLSRFNPDPVLEPRVTDLNASTIESELGGADLVLDGSDNLEARYLINDWAISTGTPWIYGACVAARGMTAVVIPGQTPCLKCLFPEPPPLGSLETCDTAGIIAPAATLVASLQVAEALKILVDDLESVRRTLLSVELWPFRILELGGGSPRPSEDCAACARKELVHLDRDGAARTLAYCGRDAVQIVPATTRPGQLDLVALERRLADRYATRHNGHVLRVTVPEGVLTLFDDGRALISGTGDEARARSLYDRYVGS